MKNNDLRALHEEFIDAQKCARKASNATIKSYESVFTLFIKLMGDQRCEDIVPRLMTKYFSRLDERERIVGRGKIKKGVKKSTIATHRSKLNSFFKWCKSQGYISSDPFSGIEYPNVVYEDRRYLRKEEVEKVFTAVALNMDSASSLVRRRNLAIISVLLFCGIRKGELLGMRVMDVDFTRKELTVRAETSKSKRERIIPINSRVVTTLKDYLEERKKKKYTDPSLWVSAVSDTGFKESGLKHFIDNLKRVSGVNCHLHRFRHTFAVNYLNGSNGNIACLKQIMGHQDIRMTSVYLRQLPSPLLRADIEGLSLDNLV